MAKAKAHTLFYERKRFYYGANIKPDDIVMVSLVEFCSDIYGTFYILEQKCRFGDSETKNAELVGPTKADAVRQAVRTFDDLLAKHPNREELQ